MSGAPAPPSFRMRVLSTVQRFNPDGSPASTSPEFDYSGASGLDQARDGGLGSTAR